MILVRDIQRITAEHYKVSFDTMHELDGVGSRERDKAHPRQMAMLVARKMTRKQYTLLGRIFRRDHSTIISGIRAARRRCLEDREHLEALCKIRARVLETAAVFSVDDPRVPQVAENCAGEEVRTQYIHSCATYVPLDAVLGSDS